jgi:hypothetical protein
MSAQRRVTAPPDFKAEVVTNSLRPDSLQEHFDPFSEPPPGSGWRSGSLLTQRIFFATAVSSSAPILSGAPGTGAFLF